LSSIHPLLEEVHWRGISPEPFQWLCWQDLLFAGYHLFVLAFLVKTPWLGLVFAVLVCGSVFWRWSVQRFGGYGVAILTHAVADASVLVAVQYLMDG
jgi:membrane protease YdiL (CAAX protease family)